MPRTPAQIEAAERDGPYCLWSRCGANEPALVLASDTHHLAHRRPGSDRPELIMHLSHNVHMRHHQGLGPTTSQLLDLMLALYGLDLRHDFPLFFASY